MDLTGLGGWEEPYVKAELLANAQKVAIAAGTLRVSSDPTFRIAKLSPYEVNVTSYVDRNIARLSPAAYDAKITSMAMRALRRAVISLIFNGDGQASPDFFGIKTAKNKDNEPIFKTVAVSGVNVDLLDDLVFAYGGDEEMGGNAALYLAKKDLKAIGRLRGTNEKQRLYKVASSPGNANTGTITDGGLIIPYALGSALTELTGATAGAEAIQTMLYGDPANFLLGLFGGFSIRIDESYKAAERMFTILGDVMVGGNLIADEGFVVATVPAAGG
jgi:HK97 family phage major capsid protein